MATKPESGEVKVKNPSSDNPTPPAVEKPRRILAPGQVVAGNYEVIEQIGEGGMAVVYKATQLSLKRPVALKALHPRLAKDAEFIERFEAEAGALATLSHPNIVGIIDRGRDGDVFYFVMELVDGETLDQKIIDNKLTPNDWRGVVTACSDALDFVHKRGVVHRDIKPSNILIDGEGRVKIGDFGIAHILAGDKSAHSTLGSTRAVGTAYYMAPEQTSDPSGVDHRADIYSLAVAFYKMLTRQLPVGEFPAPSEANHEVPVAVDAVIFQAMAVNREDRHGSVKEFCEEVQKALRQQTMSITSILNYRNSNSSSSLYTGADFRKGGNPSSPENKKPNLEGDAKSKSRSGIGVKSPATGTGAGQRTPLPVKTPPPTRSSKPGVEGSGRVTASRDLTPLPLSEKDRSSGGDKKRKSSKGPPPKPSKVLPIAIAAIAIVGLATIIFAVLSAKKDEPSTGSVVPITNTVSPAKEREDRERKEREERERRLLERKGPSTDGPILP